MQAILKEIILTNIIINQDLRWYDYTHCMKFYTLLSKIEYKSKEYYELLDLFKISFNNRNTPHRIIKLIKNQTDELCKLAIKLNPPSMAYVSNQSKEIIKYALNFAGGLIFRIRRFDKYSIDDIFEFYKIAINQCPIVINYIDRLSLSPDQINELYEITSAKGYNF
jgi:hypothetical protein